MEEGKTFLSDAFDYKGAAAEKAKTGGWVSAATILGKFPFSCFSFFICSLEKVICFFFKLFYVLKNNK